MDDREAGAADQSGDDAGFTGDPGVDPERRAHNRDLLRRYITDVLGAGDVDVVDEIFHEEVEMNARDGSEITGREAAKEYLASVRDRFSDIETEVDVVMATEDEALGKFYVTAVHEDDYFGVDPTNREVRFRVFSKAEIEDGKMKKQGDLVNPLRMQPPSKRHGRSAVLEQIGDGVVVLDREGRVVDVNPVAKELLGVADRDVLNEPVESLFECDVDLPPVGSSSEVTLDDGRRIVEVSASTLTDLQDERIGRVLVFRDVTERVRRRQQLELLTRRNEELDRSVSVVTHDLRNPVSTAAAALNLARETGKEEHFDEAQAALDRVSTIIEDLGTMAGTGTAVEETMSVSLGDLARRAWQTAETGDATVAVRVPDGFTVEADPHMLQHVMENFFRNAADHNDGAPNVTVGTLDGEAGFYVEDDGEGIPPADREEVFEQWYTTSDDGTGFGLAIVQEFVQAHGWRVTVAESDDGGARFEVWTGALQDRE